MTRIEGMNLQKLIPLYDKQGIEESMAEAVLKGVVKGWAHVDDAARPSKALVLHAHAGIAFWLGEEPDDDQAKAFTQELLAYQSDREFCTWMEFGKCPGNVGNYITQKISNAHWSGRVCWNYKREAFALAPEPALGDGIDIVIYDHYEDLPEEARTENLLFWDKASDATRHAAVAVALDSQDRMVGLCNPAAVVDDYWEIDIAVGKDHRRAGIGYAMAYAFIKECLERGCLPRWNCRRDNTASYNLAKKLGFEPVNEYDLITWDT